MSLNRTAMSLHINNCNVEQNIASKIKEDVSMTIENQNVDGLSRMRQ